MKRKLLFTLKLSVALLSVLGVALSMTFATREGYSHPAKRLLYFTGQSNVWIGISCLLILLLPHIKRLSESERVKRALYLLRYVFVISITLTSLIFCVVLAPNAHKDNYDAWTVSSVITHCIVPALAILDFIIDEYRIEIKRHYILYTAIPPLLYSVFAIILGLFNVDFGRGDTFPYFFLNLKSPAGFFGTSNVMPYKIGSFYWMLFILLIVLSFGALYMKLNNALMKRSKRR